MTFPASLYDTNQLINGFLLSGEREGVTMQKTIKEKCYVYRLSNIDEEGEKGVNVRG